MSKNQVLSAQTRERVTEAIMSVEKNIASELQIIEPSVYFGVSVDRFDDVMAYVYLPDVRSFIESDSFSKGIEDSLFEISLKLNRVSTELLQVISSVVSSVSVGESSFSLANTESADSLNPGIGCYYTLSFNLSDVEELKQSV